MRVARFPEGFEGAAFVAEPVHNLVHRDVVAPKGSTFVASRGRRDMEFLASTDSWFRPVNLYVGPDAALYVIDYYRPYIEHPEWGSSDLQKNPGVLSTGKDRGRIYRVVAADGGRTRCDAASRSAPARVGVRCRARRGAGASQSLVAPHGAASARERQPARRDAGAGAARRRETVGAGPPSCALDARRTRSARDAARAAGPCGR